MFILMFIAKETMSHSMWLVPPLSPIYFLPLKKYKFMFVYRTVGQSTTESVRRSVFKLHNTLVLQWL